MAAMRKLALAFAGFLVINGNSGCAKRHAPSGDSDRQLIDAIIQGKTAKVRELLDAGADIETRAKDQNDATLLIVAADRGEASTVKLLLERGANVQAKDHSDDAALDEAARRANVEMVKMLLARIPDVAEKNHALFSVVSAGQAILQIEPLESIPSPPAPTHSPYFETAKLLLDNGASVEARNEENSTPLIDAAAYGQTEIFELLLERGADVNAKDKYGNTPLIAAACECAVATMPSTYDVIKILLDKKVDVNARNNDGSTALMLAVTGFGALEIAKMLITHGANVKARNNKGETALSLAVKADRTDSARLLKHGRTP